MITTTLLTLCLAAFAAGFIDAIVGGGGLVQTPAVLVTLPDYPVATLLGTTKIPSFFGTSMAAFQYARIVRLHWKLLALMCSIAFAAAYAGSYAVSILSNAFLKPVILTILVIVAVYTYGNKRFGIGKAKTLTRRHRWVYAPFFAAAIGFYDGFIGPGAGSFIILFLIGAMGFDFLKASAHAKFINLATNTGSILFFGGSGHILFHFAIPMAACNFAGAAIGSRLAILKGNAFIRIFFLLIITGTIIRFAYDIFLRN